MIDLQQDLTDVIARGLAPSIVKITEKALTQGTWTKDQRASIEYMLSIFRSFDGKMEETSIPATIYSFWQYFFYQSLFTKYTNKGKIESKVTEIIDGKEEPFWNLKKRLLLVDNYAFYDYYQRMIYAVASGENHQRYQRICQGYDEEFKGNSHCEHNIALAFYEAHQYLLKEISTKEKDW